MRCLVASRSKGLNFAIIAYGRAPIEKLKVLGTIIPKSSNAQRLFTAVFRSGFEWETEFVSLPVASILFF